MVMLAMLLQALSSIRSITSYLYEYHPHLFDNDMLRLKNEWGNDWTLTHDGYIIDGPHHPPAVLDAVSKLYDAQWSCDPKPQVA